MSPDKTAIEKLWEKHTGQSFTAYTSPDTTEMVMTYRDFLAALSEAEGERWISVEERLPKEYNHVLVYRSGYKDAANNGIEIATMQRQSFGFTFSGRGWGVTHWQPLPTPPKEKP